MHRSTSGYTLIDILFVLAILGLVTVLALPSIFTMTGALRLEMAAHQMAGALRTARLHAIRRSANVAVKFRTEPDGTVTYALYRDGDGDGVRNRDIDDGTDPEVWAPRPLTCFNRDIRVGIPPGRPPRHPGNPSRRLDRLDDPIRFNRSDLASFSPRGKVTPGSIYLTNSYNHLVVVRTYHLSGKVTILAYDNESETWYKGSALFGRDLDFER